MNEFKSFVERHITMYQEKIEYFGPKFSEDPVNALEWSHTVFRDAARLKVAQIALSYLAKGRTLQQLHAEMLERALRGAKFPQRSTSATANLASEEMTAAFADMAETVEGWMK